MVTRQLANECIIALIKSKDFTQCIDKIEPDYLRPDLASEVYLALLETSPEKIIELHEKKELRFYAVRIIFNMACSNTSPFYKKFRNLNSVYRDNNERDFYDEEGNLQSIDSTLDDIGLRIAEICNVKAFDDEKGVRDRKKLELLALYMIDELYWYDADILKSYLEYGSYRAVSEATKIPFTSIYCTVQKAVKELKTRIDKLEIPTDRHIDNIIVSIKKKLLKAKQRGNEYNKRT